ncbi:MAG: hypothetical protein JJE39_13640 [Vicinamibacteria bacterium]|nr:hypothetical protein [Vicinamibacteria bacterium]
METLGIYEETARAFLSQVGAFLPRLLIAMVVVVGGWLIAKLTRFAVTKALKAINFNVLTTRSGFDSFLRQGGFEGGATPIFSGLAYWLVILASLLIALNGLGLTYITDLLSRVVWFVPNVFVALLVLTFGSYFAGFIGDSVVTYCRNIKVEGAAFLGKLAQYAIMVFVIVIALDQVKVGGDILRETFLILLSGCVFALSLAFGLGAKGWAADRIENWWPRDKKLKPGDDAKLPR